MPNELDGSQTPSTDTSDTPASAPVDANSVANAAAAAHIRRFAEKQLPGMLEAALKPIYEKLTAAPAKQESSSDDEGKGKAKISPEMQAALAQVEDMKKKMAEAEAKAQAAERKNRDDKAVSELRASLQPHVKADLLEILTDHLFHRKGVVDFEDDGTPVFKSRKSNTWGDEEEVRLPLKAGVEQFLKSADAKPFLPAPGSATAPPAARRNASPAAQAARSGEADLSKMSEREKIAHAERFAAEYAAKSGR